VYQYHCTLTLCVHHVGIDATQEKIFDALTTIEGLRGWWVSTASGSAAKGGLINFGFCDMEGLAAERSKFVHWRCTRSPDEWLNTEVTFKLEWKEEQTFVLFKHSKSKEPVEFMHHCSTKWATFLLSLRDSVERSAGRPVPCDQKIHVGD
jgi:uncharacterized protein YndB with AHSA1/START domain